VDLDKDLLCDVVCIIVVDHHFANMPIHFLLVRAYKQIESVVPGFRISDLGQEFFVFQG
jgi:hypothetical protein